MSLSIGLACIGTAIFMFGVGIIAAIRQSAWAFATFLLAGFHAALGLYYLLRVTGVVTP